MVQPARRANQARSPILRDTLGRSQLRLGLRLLRLEAKNQYLWRTNPRAASQSQQPTDRTGRVSAPRGRHRHLSWDQSRRRRGVRACTGHQGPSARSHGCAPHACSPRSSHRMNHVQPRGHRAPGEQEDRLTTTNAKDHACFQTFSWVGLTGWAHWLRIVFQAQTMSGGLGRGGLAGPRR